ncbi:hypothetical protein C2G38_2152406 [Gigaspora rosea]|uniref:Uncharacterized protein n=1 Tax=Gigaspora rosea TaxID=44941 RepID=A0A397WAB7_9GLOM|nr:hypothetical protein C2G38_2152406 [Gigaspora rosea]
MDEESSFGQLNGTELTSTLNSLLSQDEFGPEALTETADRSLKRLKRDPFWMNLLLYCVDGSTTQVTCGYCYQNGIRVEKMNETFAYYEQSADMGKVRGIFQVVGNCYKNGIGVEKNEWVFTYYERSADTGNVRGTFQVGIWAKNFLEENSTGASREKSACSDRLVRFAEKEKAHRVFYNTLRDIKDNHDISQKVRNIAQNLINNSKADIEKVNSLWRKASKASPLPVTPSFVDVPLQADGSVDILETVKSTVRIFDQKIIALGSSCSYKSSNHLFVDSEQNVEVPRESTYDAEMYRILVNWLAKVHGFEINAQWHLEGIGSDGDRNHLFCDLTIKKLDNLYPEAVLEVVATGSVSTLMKHFDRAMKYADQLCPKEVWIVHFSREGSVVSDPYWPCEKLQNRGLNVIHFWHDEEFENNEEIQFQTTLDGLYYITCDSPIESTYFSWHLKKLDICYWCRESENLIEPSDKLKAEWKKIYPLCAFCKKNGKTWYKSAQCIQLSSNDVEENTSSATSKKRKA